MIFPNRDVDSFDHTIMEDAEWTDIDLSAVEGYRRERALAHPAAEELRWNNQELLQLLGCAKTINNQIKPTVAGILLFGTSIALRRFFSNHESRIYPRTRYTMDE